MAKRKPWRIEFVFPGNPRTKSNNYRFSNKNFYINTPVQKYEKALKDYATMIMDESKQQPLPEPKLIKATICYYYPSKRRKDLTNLPKTTFDALNKIIYEDDFQIHEVTLKRRLDRNNPRVHVIVEEMRDLSWEQG